METKLVFEKELISTIKNKPELKSLDDHYVKLILSGLISEQNILKLNSYKSFKQCFRSAIYKSLVSDSRKLLRERYGVFIRNSLSSFEKKLNSITDFNDPLIDLLLTIHQSTFERKDHYEHIYPLLFETLFSLGLKKDFSLGDFACGYNPLAYKYFPVLPKNYFVCDLSSVDMSLISSFFNSTNILGSAKAFDLLSYDFSDFLSKNIFDVVFLFKALDSLETVKKNISKKLLTQINTSYFVISFPLISIGGNKVISSSKRVWFEKFCEKNSWSYEVLSITTEVFYIVKKSF